LLSLGLFLTAPRDGIAAPSVVDGGASVAPLVTGLSLPTSIAFLAPDDLLVLSKASGQVRRILGGVDQGAVLDVPVNFASERGLLGIALHPSFPTEPYVYLYWTESSTGADTNVVSNVPLRGNRVDRFLWNGSTLSFDGNIIQLRARQTDNVPVPGQSAPTNPFENGNHDGGVIRFGPDGKLYVFIGDVGRRGQLQNLPNGPFLTAPFVDDTFGGPAPDNAHLSGVVLRLNPDGTAPADNPFFAAGAALGGEVGANVQKIFSYGHRNGFGMAFDPMGGSLWLAEDGDDASSELNRVTPGMNGGWVQIMGPVSRVADFKNIETTFGSVPSLQQVRFPPDRLAGTPSDALDRLFVLAGSAYRDPVLSWKWEIAPAGLGFLTSGTPLGSSRPGDLFMGAATPLLEEGYLFRFRPTTDRTGLRVTDPALEDGVADNLAKHDLTESESLLFGRGFGVVTDIQTGPNGRLYVVSLSQGAIYEIRASPTTPENRNQLACQVGASAALRYFVSAKTKCITACLKAARKTGGPFADCLPPFGGETAACIRDSAMGVEAKAHTKIAKRCAKDCPDCYEAGGNCPAGAELVAGAEFQVDANGPAVFCREASGAAPTKQEAKCEDGVSKGLVKIARSKSRCVSRCVARAARGAIDVADCDGPSVADPTTLECIARVAFRAFAAIEAACTPPRGSVPACHSVPDAAGWVMRALSDVDVQTPQLFCGFPSPAFLD
jgi:glucose/arabinose dehydrogenase